MKQDDTTAFPEDELFAAISGSVSSALSSSGDFSAAVHRRVAARTGSLVRDEPRETSLWDRFAGQSWLRAAASLLPAGVAPHAFAGAAWKTPAAKGLLGKSLGFAMVPLFVAAIAVASFTSSISRTATLDGSRGRVQADRLGRKELSGWLSANIWVALGVALLLALLFYLSPLDAGVFMITAGLLSNAIVARRLSDQGLADTKSLYAHIVPVSVQLALALHALGSIGFGRESATGAMVTLTGYGVVVLTLLLTAPFQPRRWFFSSRPLTPRLRRLDVAVSVLMAVGFAVCWAVLFGAGDPDNHLRVALRSEELSLWSLRLPLAAALYLALVTKLMARAPMPRPRGKRRAR